MSGRSTTYLRVNIIQSVRWSPSGDAVLIIDQRLLPGQCVERELRTLDDVCDAIVTLAVRGAPAIGIAGAMGLVVALAPHQAASTAEFLEMARSTAERIRATRPTAVNLPWALDRMLARARSTVGSSLDVLEALRAEATTILDEDRAMCRRIGDHGAGLIPANGQILTHCNAGALATGGMGTALAAIYVAAERGLHPSVYADETRPLLQGSRLTAWELSQAGIPVTVLADGAAAALMSTQKVDLVIVGADRIAANGDVANKIGTYAVAIAAKHHGIPFYVAAPWSTFDPATPSGEEIRIEQRGADEIRRGFGSLTAPPDVAVYNPAFDVTPASLITAIISDRAGVHRPPVRLSVTMRHVLAIDQGTTGSTSLVVAADGRIVGRGYREIPQHFPQPGWVEHDAMEILEATLATAREAIAASGVTPDAIGITNQRETIVVWERATGRPVHQAIVWQDRRTAPRCAELAATHGERIRELTGLVVDAYFSASKLEWLLWTARLLDRYPVADLAAGTIDTWLIWQLTGGRVHATDPTNASRTMLYDINTMSWSPELCTLFGVPPELLPDVRRSSGDFGVARAELFGSAIPICGVAGDQQAALFGQGCWNPGEGKNTYGTGAFLLLNSGTARPAAEQGLLTTVACDASGAPAYALEASIFIAGAALQWLRDGLGIIQNAAESEALARGLESNDGVYFVPALTGLGAPYWEQNARGTIVGLTRGSTRAHLARAALEAMAYGTSDVLHRMASGSGAAFHRLRVDGGATMNDWLMQFQADILGVAVERPDVVETTALGAAGLAGMAAGVWTTADEFIAGRTFTLFHPSMSRDEAARRLSGWHRAVGAATFWARAAE